MLVVEKKTNVRRSVADGIQASKARTGPLGVRWGPYS
jgi:hypothetical protein